MAYKKQTFKDNETVLKAEHLDHIEYGIVSSAELDEEHIAHFKNCLGVVLFSVDLSGLGVPLEYGDLVLSAESLTIAEGGSGTFTVKLASAPSVKQTVYLALSDNTKMSVSPASLVFTPNNWATEQTVTLTTAQDEDMKHDSLTVTLTSKNVDGKQLVVSVTDDDIPVLVEEGLGFYVSLRNLSSKNSADTEIVDSVGGVACTLSTDIAFDDTSGFVNDNGLTCPKGIDKLFKFAYPLKTAKAPNGFTVEYTMTGICAVHASGSGHQGYVYKSNLLVGTASSYWIQCGLARAGTAGNSWPSSDSNYNINESAFSLDDEHTYTLVQEVDGVTHCYIDGELTHTAPAPDGFTNYVCSGSMSFAIPYSDSFGTDSLVISSMRIYERALTSDEVKNNFKYEVSQRAVSDF